MGSSPHQPVPCMIPVAQREMLPLPPTNTHTGHPFKPKCGLLASGKALLFKLLVISSSFSPFPPGVRGLRYLTRTEFPEPSFPYSGSWGMAGKLHSTEGAGQGECGRGLKSSLGSTPNHVSGGDPSLTGPGTGCFSLRGLTQRLWALAL